MNNTTTNLDADLIKTPSTGNNYYTFKEGEYVYAIENGTTLYTRANILSINDGIYTIQFDNGSIQDATLNELLIYYPCNCNGTYAGFTYRQGFIVLVDSELGIACEVFPNNSIANDVIFQ